MGFTNVLAYTGGTGTPSIHCSDVFTVTLSDLCHSLDAQYAVQVLLELVEKVKMLYIINSLCIPNNNRYICVLEMEGHLNLETKADLSSPW